MAKSEHVPAPAVRRLSLYLRQLEAFSAVDRPTVSSRDLGDALGLTDAQIRKDLAYFGHFGRPGVGYHVTELIQRVRRILGTDKKSNVLLVGVGNLGRALLSYRGFAKQGFELTAAFDKDRAIVGKTINPGSIRVRPMSEMPKLVRAKSVRLGILSVPAPAAQDVADRMVKAGVRCILNFAPTTLQLRPGIAVSSVDLAVHLEQLSFQLMGSTK